MGRGKLGAARHLRAGAQEGLSGLCGATWLKEAGQGASGKQGAAGRQRQIEYWIVVGAASVGV